MRRARISIKPNVRPGGRSVAPAAEGQESTALDDTQQIESTSLQSQPEVKESAVAGGDGDVPGSPSEKASLNTNDRAPSSVNKPATPSLQRRTRFSATPNLAKPKVRSAAPPVPAEKSVSLPSKSSKNSSFQTAKSPVAVDRDDSQNSKLSDTSTEAHCPPSSPCPPESSSSTQSYQEPCKTPLKIPSKDVGPLQGATPYSYSPNLKLSRVDGPGSPLRDKINTDKDRVLRALKLKELMKLERRKESMKQNGRRKHEHYNEMDRDKMTIADFIYYLPETNPMKSSLSMEETQTEQTTTTIPQSPMVQKKMNEADKDDKEEDDDDDMLVPKVKVAEDGSLILDEESLTVRVQRTSDTVVENAIPLFERGSTTTYRSFRKHCFVKAWSVRETDMFYLAISMVGTDFSMMAQLLTHRNRAEIKRKFRREEKENSWRVDKAFRDKRPYDAQFFSFLLKRILAKDKEKGKAIKLVVKSSKTRRNKGGSKAKEIVKDFCDDNDDCDEVCSVDSVVSFDLEKENEDSNNVKEADVPSSKKRKRKKDDKSCVKTSKSKKTTRKGKCSVEDCDLEEDEDNYLMKVDSVDADNKDQSGMSVLKKKCKQSKRGDREKQKEKPNAKEKCKKKRKKALKVQNEEPADGEGEAVKKESGQASTVPTKKRKRSKKCAKEDEDPTQSKPKTKKIKTSQEVCIGPEPDADGGEVSTTAPNAEGDQGEELNPDSTAQEDISERSSKRLKKPLPNLLKRKNKKCTKPKAAVEHEEALEEPEDETHQEAENEILHLAEKQLHNQPVVILERTPPREELNPDTTAQEEISIRSSKRSRRPVPKLLQRKAKKCTEPKSAIEHEDAVEKPEDETHQDAENESRILHLAEELLQNQPVVILERTPPREEFNSDTTAQEEISQSPSKRSKRPLPNLPKAIIEHAVEKPEDETHQEAENESRILHLAQKPLQNQPVVILERTSSREELNSDTTAKEEMSQSPSRRSKRPLPNLLKAKKCTEPKAIIEHEDAVEKPEDETHQEAENESRILHLAQKPLQNQSVVILERTPSREDLNSDTTAKEEMSQSPSRRSKRPLQNLLKDKKCTEPRAAIEHEDAVEKPEDETHQEAENESRILHLAEKQLPKQPVVILKRTPPREDLNPDISAHEESLPSSYKRSKRPLPNLLKGKAKKITEPKAAVDHEDAVKKPEDETLQDAKNESRILHLAEKLHQNQPVVILERTPSREELNPDTTSQDDFSQSLSKHSKPKAAVEHEDAVEKPEDEIRQLAERESRILRFAEELFLNQPVVILERTPPREELNPNIPAQDEISQSSSKCSKRPLPNLLQIKTKKCTEPKAVVEQEKAVEKPEDKTLQDAENESRILCLAEEQLQNQPVVVLERTPQRFKDLCNSSDSQCGPLSPESPQQSPGRQMRAEKVKRNLTSADDGSTDLGRKEDHREKLMLEEFYQSSSRCSPRQQMGAVKIPPILPHPERENMDQCSDTSVEDMRSTARLDQVVCQDSEVIEEGFIRQHLELNSSGVNGQTSLKRAFVSVSHQEVEHHLRIQTQSAAEESTSSDTTPARGHHVEEHRDSSIVTVFQVPEIKDADAVPISAQRSITGTRRRVLKPRPSLSRPAQSSRRPDLSSANSLYLKHNSTPLECSNPVEEQVKPTANQNLEEELRDHPEEKDTQTISPEENSIIDVKDDDSPSLTSVDVLERRTELEKSPSQMSDSEDQISDKESEIIDAVMSWMNNEALCEFDPAEISEHQRSVRDQHCDLDQDKEPFSLLSSVEDLQQCKQDKDVLCPVPLLSSTQTPVPVDSANAKNEKNNPVFSHASSVETLDSSFSDHPTQHTSNLYDTDTMMFSVPAVENTQIAKQDGTEELSSVFENWSVPLSGNSKLEVSNSAGVETGAADFQSEEEPTFILTLYEIPNSQLFSDAVSAQQDTLPYDLQPAQIQTPSLFTGSSQSLSFTIEASSASPQTASEEPEIPCESVSYTDDSLAPLSKDPTDAKDTRIQLISSQESSCDGANSLISASERLSCSSAMLTDVPNLDEISTKTSKVPTQRRSKIKVKPKLKPCLKAGPSRNDQSDSAQSQSLPSSHVKAKTEVASDQKTSVWETVVPNISEDSEKRAHPGHDSVVSVVTVPVFEEMRDEIPLRTDHEMEEDSIDLPVRCRGMKESKEETDGGCFSHMVLADAFMFCRSGEMDNVFNDNSHGGELQEPIDLSMRLPERDKFPYAVIDQQETIMDSPENLDTCKMASSELTSQEKSKPFRRGKLQVKPKVHQKSTNEDFSRREQSDIGFNDPATAQIISPVPLIKKELVERTEQEDFSEEELNTRPAVTTLSSQDLMPFTSKNKLACTDSPPVELKIEGGHEDVMHTVLCDIFVPVSIETEDDSFQMGELSLHSLHEEETRSHVLPTDKLTPVCEDIGDDLSKDWETDRERTSHEARRPQEREKSKSSPVKSSASPKWNSPAKGKGKLLVKMTFPKRKNLLNSPNSGGKSQAVSPTSLKSEQEADAMLKAECISEPELASPQCSVVTITSDDLLLTGSEGHEEGCGGVSHLVLSDIFVPVLDDSTEQSLKKEASSAGLQENTVKKSVTASPSVSVEWKTPSCRRATLHPKPDLSKRIDDPSQTDNLSSGSVQTSLATTLQSLDHQAEEWSLKSNMLPNDSAEIENWCEGVSHMLMSDAFVPVSEEIRENSTNLKVFSSSPHKNEECAPSMERKSVLGNSDQTRQTDTTTDMTEIEESKESRPARQAIKTPTRSTFQMTLRSPQRSLKDHPNELKSPKAAPKAPQRSPISEVKKSVGSPTRQHVGEISNVCSVQIERLSLEEIRSAQSVLQPKHHSTPVTVKTTSRGNEMHTGCLVLLGSRSPGFESQADKESHVPPGFSPKVVLQRIPVTDTDANTSVPTSSPARVPAGSQTPADHQSPQNSSPGADAEKDPVEVSQFFLDDIFTEVVDVD